MFCKRSSVINSIYSGQQLFSYTSTKGDITDLYIYSIDGCGREVVRGRLSTVIDSAVYGTVDLLVQTS
jgi:hypothetical protein